MRGLNRYKVNLGNKHRMKRLIREFIQRLAEKYLPKGMSSFFKITFSLDNHLAERVIERKVNKKAFERLITGLVRDHLCEVIYLAIRNPSMTNTYMGSSDIEVTDQVLSLIFLLRVGE